MLLSLSAFRTELRVNLKLAVPIMAGQLAHLFVALADNVMVGELGAAPLAAVSLGNTLIYVALAIGIGFSFSITPLVSEADGNNNALRIRSLFFHGLVLCSLFGIVLCGALFLADDVLYHLDQPDEVLELALPYMQIVACSMIPVMAFQALKQFCDGLSETRMPMIATIVANLLNILLNYLLIYGFWGLPKLGILGAAYGTLISRIILLVLLLIFMYRKPIVKKYMSYTGRWSHSRFSRLFYLGTPTALQMLFEVALFTSAIILSGILGTDAQAANQIALNLSSLTFMIGVGLSVAATIRVGNQIGSNNMSKLRTAAASLLTLSLLLYVAFAAIFLLFHEYLPLIYIDDRSVLKIASELLLVAALFQISDGLQVVALGCLRGLQDVWIPSLICLIAYGGVGFPISYYLGLHTDYGASGIWWGLLISLTVSAVAMLIRFRYLVRLRAGRLTIPVT